MNNNRFIERITVGQKELIFSDTIFVPNESDKISFTLLGGKKLTFSFEYNAKKNISYAEGKTSEDGNEYAITLFNYSNLFGEGFSPMAFYSNSDGHQYYVSIFATTNENKSRLLTVSLYKDI